MTKTTCEILFDNNPAKVFFGGQTLSGRVILTLHKEKTVRGIYIKINGKAYCRWSEGTGENRKTYVGEECYLSEKTYLLGDNDGEQVVPPGVYTYTIHCALPIGLPTSVESEHGHIRYNAVVNLDRPMWPDQEFEEVFTVLKPLNLNENSIYRFPIQHEKRKIFYMCCFLCCCQSDPLFIVGQIPFSGYTPGQNIPVEIEVNNKSNEIVYLFMIQLVKIITFYEYKESSKTITDTIVLIEKTLEGCSTNTTNTLKTNLLVPSIPPTDTTTSNICKVLYKIRIKGSVDCFHSDPVLDLPITIGTVPLIIDSGLQQPISVQPTAPLAPYPFENENLPGYPCYNIAEPLLQPVYNTEYADIDPPTYEEAVYNKGNPIMGKHFAPRYPVYRS